MGGGRRRVLLLGRSRGTAAGPGSGSATTVPVPFEILLEEVKVSCTMGTLLCLDRRQRLVVILGVVFGVSGEVGAEIVGVTPVNFRQILCRERRDLHEYLRGNGSLLDPTARKTRAHIQGGFVDPNTCGSRPAIYAGSET